MQRDAWPKVLVDENVPRSVSDFLIRNGVECADSRALMYTSAADSDVAKAAHALRMAIITCDPDFKQRWEHQRRKTPDVQGLVLFEDCTKTPGMCETRIRDALSIIDHEFARARVVGEHPFVMIRRSRIVVMR